MRRTATVIAQHWPMMDCCSGFHFHFLSLFSPDFLSPHCHHSPLLPVQRCRLVYHCTVSGLFWVVAVYSIFLSNTLLQEHFLRAFDDGLLQCCWKVLDLPKNCKKGIGFRTKIMVPNYLSTNWKSLLYWSVEPSPITIIFRKPANFRYTSIIIKDQSSTHACTSKTSSWTSLDFVIFILVFWSDFNPDSF